MRPVEITSFNAVGNQLYINMSDGTVHGRITLPAVRWFFRGNWQTNTVYARDDVVVAPNSAVYLVTFSHTSGTSFSAGASDGAGPQLLFVVAGSASGHACRPAARAATC